MEVDAYKSATGVTIVDKDANNAFNKNNFRNIRESIDNIDLNEEFKPDAEPVAYYDGNATMGLGTTMMAKPQIIGGGGVMDVT